MASEGYARSANDSRVSGAAAIEQLGIAQSRDEAIALGLSRYFTGQPCVHGHVSVRTVANRRCIACRDQSGPRWRAAYEAKNADRIKELKAAKRRRYQSMHPQANYEGVKKWRAKNGEALNAQMQRRRAKKKGAAGRHTKDDVRRIFKEQKGRCALCRKKLRRNFHRDHIVPLALGGGNQASNIQLLCPSCNQRKNALDPIEFSQRIGLLL